MFPALLLLKVTPTAQSCSPNLLPKPAPQSCSPKRAPKLISKLLRTVTLPRYYSYPWNCLWKQLPKIIFLKFLPKIIIFQSFWSPMLLQSRELLPTAIPQSCSPILFGRGKICSANNQNSCDRDLHHSAFLEIKARPARPENFCVHWHLSYQLFWHRILGLSLNVMNTNYFIWIHILAAQWRVWLYRGLDNLI